MVESLPQPDTFAILPGDVHRQLWLRIGARLERGDSLITTRDFVTALTTEYRAITGANLSAPMRGLFEDAVVSFNKEFPERYVALGVQNSVSRAFESGCLKLDWDVIKIEAAGARSIARFKSRDWVRGFLQVVHVRPGLISEDQCVRRAVEVVAGRAEPLAAYDPSVPISPPVEAPVTKAAKAPEPEDDATEAIRDGTISQTEADERIAAQEEVRTRLESRQLQRAGEHAESYVRQGYLTSEEGEAVLRLRDIDRRLEAGEIDGDEASRLRNSLLTKEQRTALERKLKGAVDHAVRFLQTFEAMQRISPAVDDGLRFLIFHKDILDPERSPGERGRAAQELLEDRDLLHQIVDLMDRKDQEVRMISVGLPPYGYVVKRNERIGNLVVEEAFVEQLRSVSSDEMADRLHSEDPEVRVRPAADMRCLIAIINHLIKPTPWRRDVRLLRVQDTLEEFYQSTTDIGEARKQAESFLHRRLRRMFRDLTSEEKEELAERGAALIDAIEQRVLAERQAAGALVGAGAQAREDDNTLTEEEVEKGATIGRVEMRIAGQMRRVPRKIMRDPDDPATFVLAQRNAETSELEPVQRRGARRPVARSSEGYWRLLAN